jgi:hypothetical protein
MNPRKAELCVPGEFSDEEKGMSYFGMLLLIGTKAILSVVAVLCFTNPEEPML